MMNFIFKVLFLFFIITSTNANIVKNIKINGNNRISDETIILFGEIKKNKNYNKSELNIILKKLYQTDFFENVVISLDKETLIVNIVENPIIEEIEFSGVKNKTILKTLRNKIQLKEKNSFVKSKVKKDESILATILKKNGYYFSIIETSIKKNENNTVSLNYNIDLGDKAYIEKIKFIGDKKVKDRKLKRIIASEESKFWKFISNKKFLDEKRIQLDEKLLTNYYKNNGYYNVKVNSTSALVINQNKFELVFNIDAGEKYIFNNVVLNLPKNFDKKNFEDINDVLINLKNKTYSLNRIKKILDQIDEISLNKQYEFINATYNEDVNEKFIDLIINIKESEKKYVEQINILGNYLTNENVIRNSIITDEGDPYNEILFKKSINNIKSKNIFSTVESKVYDGSTPQQKKIDIIVEEKPTGEISAGAGTGTSGTTVSFSIAENNYVGQGTKLKANVAFSDNSITGLFSYTDPNYKNSEKSLITSVENSQIDLMNKFGYETETIGFSVGTSYEQFKDIFFSPKISTFIENLETSNTASAAKQKQEGNYFDTNFSYGLTLNKLNQNFQPTDGYKSSFFQELPIYADDTSIVNSYEFSKYNKFGEDSVLSFIFFAKSVNSLDDDVRVSKRIFIPSRKLRGFVAGKVGPKDGSDYIGGNFGTALNIAATIPKLLGDLQNVDFSVFLDSANIFGVDYNDSLDSNKIRSSSGLAVDWFTPIGPLSFSFALPLTKHENDETETFRFRIGTTF